MLHRTPDSQFGLDHALYIALGLYFLARSVSLYLEPWWRSRYFGWFHYVHGLYMCLTCISALELWWFIDGMIQVIDADKGRAQTGVLMIFILSITPIAVVATLVQGWLHSSRHIREIGEGGGTLKRDRVLQIICLPPIYGILALCALVELLHQVAHNLGEDHQGVAYARYETCILIADLYEAWALYQLGRLTFDVLHSTLSSTGGGQRSRHESSRDVLLTFTAVSSLAWLGNWVFVLICIIQAGYSIFLWIGHDPSKDWGKYEAAMQKFSYAGLVAAGAAVYNVATIGEVFGQLLEDFRPRLKFFIVMAIVTVAFWQLKVLLVLSSARQLFVSQVQVQDWEISAVIEVKMLHSALLIFECLACSTANKFAWDPTEEWFEDGLKDPEGRIEEGSARGERRALLAGPAAAKKGPARPAQTNRRGTA